MLLSVLSPETQALFPASHKALAYCGHAASCPEAFVLVRGRWFITAGHAGFNSRPNNGRGFTTKAAAVRCLEKYDLARRAGRGR